MRAGWPDFGAVGHKDGAGQVTDHSAAQVDEADPLGADKLFKVAHQPTLEYQADTQMEYSEIKTCVYNLFTAMICS